MSDAAHQQDDTLRTQVARELGEVTAALRDVVAWEQTGGTVGWPATGPDADPLPELVIHGEEPIALGTPGQPAQRDRARPGPTPSPRPGTPQAPGPSAAAPSPGAAPAPGSPRAAAPPPDGHAREAADLEGLRAILGECQRCRLAGGRTHIVFGQGNPNADLMLVGEGPGYHEDRKGLAFVGPAGDLLTRILKAIDLTRDDVYICNVVKCRPPQNRDPADEEIAACRPFVERQIDLVAPKVILALGRIAGRALLDRPGASLRSLRGQFHEHRGIPVMVTYHPAALLRDAKYKRPVWEDVQQVQAKLRGE